MGGAGVRELPGQVLVLMHRVVMASAWVKTPDMRAFHCMSVAPQ